MLFSLVHILCKNLNEFRSTNANGHTSDFWAKNISVIYWVFLLLLFFPTDLLWGFFVVVVIVFSDEMKFVLCTFK